MEARRVSELNNFLAILSDDLALNDFADLFSELLGVNCNGDVALTFSTCDKTAGILGVIYLTTLNLNEFKLFKICV